MFLIWISPPERKRNWWGGGEGGRITHSLFQAIILIWDRTICQAHFLHSALGNHKLKLYYIYLPCFEWKGRTICFLTAYTGTKDRFINLSFIYKSHWQSVSHRQTLLHCSGKLVNNHCSSLFLSCHILLYLWVGIKINWLTPSRKGTYQSELTGSHNLGYIRKKSSSMPGYLERAFLSVWILTSVPDMIKSTSIRVTNWWCYSMWVTETMHYYCCTFRMKIHLLLKSTEVAHLSFCSENLLLWVI